jgi:DNA-binding NarL/FixJ family response regulator
MKRATAHRFPGQDQIRSFVSCDVLSIREREVMRLAGKGFANKTIALELNVTEGTIKLHLHNIYQKLGIKGRVALALLAKDHLIESRDAVQLAG